VKKLILITALFCCFGFAKAQESDATLKETTDWITGKLDGIHRHLGGKAGDDYTYNISFDGCMCKMKEIDESPFYKQWTITEDSFNLGDISLSSFEQDHTHYDNTMFELSTENKKTIKHSYSSNDKITPVVSFSFGALYYDPSGGNLTFERIKKAFTHAIKRCGGKEEKF
jgi:hypothetical protein